MLMPEQLLGRQLDRRGRASPLRRAIRDDIGQIEFALGVVAVERIEEFAEVARLDRHDPAIDELDRALLGTGVGRLDDPLERAVGREDEAGHRRPGSAGRMPADENRRRAAAPLGQQPGQRLGR